MKKFKELREKSRCWTGYKPVPGKKPYSPGSCTKEEVDGLAEADKHSMFGKIQRGHELKKKVDTSFADIGKAQKQGDHTAASKAFRKHERYANLERPGTWTKVKEEKDPEYSDPYMAVNQLRTIMHNAQEMIDLIGEKTDLPEWVESKITLAEDYVMTVANYMRSELKEEHNPDAMFDIVEELVMEIAETHNIDPEQIWEDLEDVSDEELYESAAWRRKEGKDPKGGLNRKGVASYRRENPGSKLKMAVTTPPSKLKKGSKAANRRKSFCARMGGMKGPMRKDGKPTRKALALRKWNC